MNSFYFPPITTQRVFLRLLSLDDAEAVCQHFSDDAVTKYMDINSCQSLAEAREIIEFHIKDSGCRWGIFDKHTAKLIGTCGFHSWVKGANAKAEIGYDLSKAYWGQGMMKEVLQAMIVFGFEAMNLTRIEADVEAANLRSIGLLKNLGFKLETGQKNRLLRYYLLAYT